MTEFETYRHWRLDRDISDLIWLTIDRAGEDVNSLGNEVLEELERIVGRLENTTAAGLILISAKASGFIAGADIREFDQIDDLEYAQQSAARVHSVFNRFEALPFTKVAAISGFCLGGGLELALACNYRVALDVDHTRVGFPELQLGIYPGFGGSARAIRHLGGKSALELMLTAKLLKPSAARRAGLVDEVVGRHVSLRWAARRAALQKRSSRPCAILARLTSAPGVRHALAIAMRQSVAKKARKEHMPAPYLLIDTWARLGDDFNALLDAEAKQVPELLFTDASKSLRRVFRLQEQLKSQGKSDKSLGAWTPRRIHIVGAGVMGGDIAAWCALRGFEVTLQDRELSFIEPALTRAAHLFKRRLKSDAKVDAAKNRLIADVDGNGIRSADVIIEAIFENLDAKQALFERLEKEARPEAVLASNTSAIPLESIAERMQDPSRLIGLHFFNPVAQMPLVEVVAGSASAATMLSRGCLFANAIGKLPLPVKSSPGFLVNRVLGPYMLEALKVSQEGVSQQTIDAAAQAFGMPVGPVELADTVGLDVAISVARQLSPDNTDAIGRIQALLDAGKLGKKSGEGFYRWKNGKPVKPTVPPNVMLDALAMRLITPLIDECQSCLNEGVVATADLVDAGVIFGTGFAPFKGGPLHYAANHMENKS